MFLPNFVIVLIVFEFKDFAMEMIECNEIIKISSNRIWFQIYVRLEQHTSIKVRLY